MNSTAIYPGTFDPLTLGHMDVVERAARIFSHLTVAVSQTIWKAPLFSVDERVELARAALTGLPNVEVEPFSGLLVDYVRRRQCRVVVRGLRAFSDFEFEFQMALTNRKMAPDIETLFLMPKEDYSYVSSSTVREVAQYGGDTGDFVPESVQRALVERMGRPGAKGRRAASGSMTGVEKERGED